MLAPTYTLTLGSQQWTEQLISLELTLALAPQLNVLVARFPVAATPTAQVEDPASLTLANDDQEADLFTGQIRSVRRSFDTIEITALDAGGTLAALRPAVTYEKATAGSLIRNLCDAAAVSTGTIDDGVELAYYAADPTRTALDHVARLAAWSGALAWVTDDNKLNATVLNTEQAEIALRFGRELRSIRHTHLPAPIERFVVAGESGAGSTSAPEVLRPTTDFFAGNRPDGPSASVRWSFEPALRTTAAAATAGAALDRHYRSTRQSGMLDAFLLPKLVPGTVFEVQKLPDGLAKGPFWALQVRHRLDRRGGTTRVRFAKGGDSFDPLALLGSLLGSLL